jgi:hypothetical protein
VFARSWCTDKAQPLPIQIAVIVSLLVCHDRGPRACHAMSWEPTLSSLSSPLPDLENWIVGR